MGIRTLLHSSMCAFAGDEDDSLHTELETERDGSLAGNLRHWSRYVTHPKNRTSDHTLHNAYLLLWSTVMHFSSASRMTSALRYRWLTNCVKNHKVSSDHLKPSLLVVIDSSPDPFSPPHIPSFGVFMMMMMRESAFLTPRLRISRAIVFYTEASASFLN